MPGISLVCDFSFDNNKNPELGFLKSSYRKRYSHSIYYNNYGINISSYTYPKYPISKVETEDYLILLEGKIYGYSKKDIDAELLGIADLLSTRGLSASPKVKKWINAKDGDYIVLILNKETRSVFLFNDIFGRLPLYFYKSSTKFIISREISFASSFSNSTNLHEQSIAEFLLFGYPLGSRTLFENISYFEPAALLHIDPSEPDTAQVQLQDFNLSNNKSVDEIEETELILDLTDTFIESCKNRGVANKPNILSLSGGLDSRAVAVGLKKANVDFNCTTFNDFENSAEKDFKVGKTIANHLEIPWHSFVLDKTKYEFMESILEMKYGHNSLNMCFILDYLEQLIKNFGNNLVFFTGDGGDKTLAPIRPARKFKSIEELATYIVYKQSIFKIDQVSNLTGLNSETILSFVINRLTEYPESDFQDLYKHFIIRERAIKWLFEGEDRNRYYFWSVTPFYSTDFFRKTMELPDELKEKFKLYHKFLLKLSPKIAAFKNPAWNAPLGSAKSSLHLSAASYLSRFPLKFQESVRKLRQNKSNLSNVDARNLALLKRQIKSNESISQYLRLKNNDSFFNTLSNTQFYRVFTLTSTIDKIKSQN